jgi:hypothetical protein
MDVSPGYEKRDLITQRTAELRLTDWALHGRARQGKGITCVKGRIAEDERNTASVVMARTLAGNHLNATFSRSSELR